MPIETAKEITKVVAESGSSWWQWVLGMLGGFGGTLWAAMGGRVSRIERNMVTKEAFGQHTTDEEKKFEALFNKHDDMANDISAIRASVARIEGHISK